MLQTLIIRLVIHEALLKFRIASLTNVFISHVMIDTKFQSKIVNSGLSSS